jgi:hypothetical protein
MKRTMTQDELQRYERALILWEQGLKKETAELDAREAELEEREDELGVVYVPTELDAANQIVGQNGSPIDSIVFDDGCTTAPEEFVTTLPACGPKCYEGGEHTADCARMIYLEVERIGNL